jgi:hypothetical protein
MYIDFTHNNKTKLQAISARLKAYTGVTAYRAYVDTKITSENLEYNLAFLLAEVILNLTFKDKSRRSFEQFIAEFNQREGTSISIEDFENLHWIKIINNEVTLPNLIFSYIWRVSDYEEKRKPVDIAAGKEQLTHCLKEYYRVHLSAEKPFISREPLESVLSEFKNVTIEYLIEAGVLSTQDSKFYYWEGHEQTRHLRNELSSILWLKCCENEPTEDNFRRFLQLLDYCTHDVPEGLDHYLNRASLQKLTHLSWLVLKNEPDLNGYDDEFKKIWMDSARYFHIGIEDDIPVLKLEARTSYELIEEIEFHRRFDEMFSYQQGRGIYYLLLRFVIQYDMSAPIRHGNVLTALKSIEKPFLAWSTYNMLDRDFSGVIPYLLCDTELAPLAFKLIDEFEVDRKVILETDRFENAREVQKIRNDLWLNCFDVLLEQLVRLHDQKEAAHVLFNILYDLSAAVFRTNSNNEFSVIQHQLLRERYDTVLNRIKEIKAIGVVNYEGRIVPRYFPSILRNLFDFLKSKKQRPHINQYINIQTRIMDLGIELLRLSNVPLYPNEVLSAVEADIRNVNREITEYLADLIKDFYKVEEVEVITYKDSGIETQKAQRGVGKFGIEIIDWGYLYCHLVKHNLFDSLHEVLNNTIVFDGETEEKRYSDQNREQIEKLSFALTTLMLAFLNIHENRTSYEMQGLPVSESLKRIESLISDYSLTYNTEDLPQGKVNIFDERFRFMDNDIYRQSLISMLFKCVNLLETTNKLEFVNSFFDDSIDIGKMLRAINILEAKPVKDAIAHKINEGNVKEFQDSQFDSRELVATSVEAVNSDTGSHWDMAKPLLERVERHYEKQKVVDHGIQITGFEIRLLLAYKRNDEEKIKSTEVPSIEGYRTEGENKKELYLALHDMFFSKDYRAAISKLEKLRSHSNKPVYAFYLYRARTLLALTKKDYQALRIAKHEWDNFLEEADRTSQDVKDEINAYSSAAEANDLHFYSNYGTVKSFQLAVSKLSGKYLYDNELIEPIYQFYLSNGLHVLANEYLNSAVKYHEENSDALPDIINELRKSHSDEQLIAELKMVMNSLRAQRSIDIPRVVPNSLNGKIGLNDFILSEIIQACKVLSDKIKSVDTIKDENKYSDLLQAILTLRLVLWGWEITDQARVGTSEGGKGLGESDLLVKASGVTIALLEAFPLHGGDKPKTQRHILKCFGYNSYLNRYYSITYFIGSKGNFDNAWESYKTNVLDTAFPVHATIEGTKEFINLDSDYEDVRSLKIAKTIHKGGMEFFHVMINLGT